MLAPASFPASSHFCSPGVSLAHLQERSRARQAGRGLSVREFEPGLRALAAGKGWPSAGLSLPIRVRGLLFVCWGLGLYFCFETKRFFYFTKQMEEASETEGETLAMNPVCHGSHPCTWATGEAAGWRV